MTPEEQKLAEADEVVEAIRLKADALGLHTMKATTGLTESGHVGIIIDFRILKRAWDG